MIGKFTIQIRTLRDDQLAAQTLENFFEALVLFNVAFLLRNPRTPNLYQSGVRYRREAKEDWKDIPTILRDRFDDCEGLSCYLAAQLRVRNERPEAQVKLIQQPTTTRKLWHAIVVDVATGEKWDPSKVLGMKGAA